MILKSYMLVLVPPGEEGGGVLGLVFSCRPGADGLKCDSVRGEIAVLIHLISFAWCRRPWRTTATRLFITTVRWGGISSFTFPFPLLLLLLLLLL